MQKAVYSILMCFLCFICCTNSAIAVYQHRTSTITQTNDSATFIHDVQCSNKLKMDNPTCWKCFLAKNVDFAISDPHNDELDPNPKIHFITLTATAYTNYDKNTQDYQIKHEYCSRELFFSTKINSVLNQFLKLTKRQKYVCIAGNFTRHKTDFSEYKGKKQEVYYWIFKKIRSKTGCSSGFDGFRKKEIATTKLKREAT